MLEASPCTLNCIDLMVNFSLSEYCFLIFCILSRSRCRTSWRWRCQVARGCSERQKSSVWRIQVDRICWLYKIWIFKRVFYRIGAPQGEFQISMDCTYRPNDVVPIIGKMRRVFLNLLQTYWTFVLFLDRLQIFWTFIFAVGCALAGLVLMVLVAYLVGEQYAKKKNWSLKWHLIFLYLKLLWSIIKLKPR